MCVWRDVLLVRNAFARSHPGRSCERLLHTASDVTAMYFGRRPSKAAGRRDQSRVVWPDRAHASHSTIPLAPVPFLSARLSVRLSVRRSVCPSVCQSVCPPVCQSVCLSVCLSVDFLTAADRNSATRRAELSAARGLCAHKQRAAQAKRASASHIGGQRPHQQ